MADRYERVYDVGLLDDLHNYFPGLLYEPDRFRTVSDVLGYVRQNASRRFNLFDYGARQYQQQNNRVPQNTFTRQTPVVNRWTPQVPITQPAQYEFDLQAQANYVKELELAGKIRESEEARIDLKVKEKEAVNDAARQKLGIVKI